MSVQTEKPPFIWTSDYFGTVSVTLPERLWFVTPRKIMYSPWRTGLARVERVSVSRHGHCRVTGQAFTSRVGPYKREGSMPIADLPPKVKDYLLLHITTHLLEVSK